MGRNTRWIPAICLALTPIAALALRQAEPAGPIETSHAAFDCVTKSGDFCQGELGNGNSCVTTTTCTQSQLAECLPGFSMCDEHADEHAMPVPVPAGRRR